MRMLDASIMSSSLGGKNMLSGHFVTTAVVLRWPQNGCPRWRQVQRRLLQQRLCMQACCSLCKRCTRTGCCQSTSAILQSWTCPFCARSATFPKFAQHQQQRQKQQVHFILHRITAVSCIPESCPRCLPQCYGSADTAIPRG